MDALLRAVRGQSRGVIMTRRALVIAMAGLTGAAAAQDTFVYDFQLVVVSNEVIANAVGGELSTLPVGTVGHLRVLLTAEPGDYPDWNLPVIHAHDVLEISFSAGDVTAQGAPGVYPTTNPFVAMQMQNDGWLNYPAGIKMDFFGTTLAWDHPEFAYSSLAIRQYSEPGELPLLFTSIELPTSANLNLAERKIFGIDSALSGADGIRFEVTAMEGTLVPRCAADVNRDGTLSPADFNAWIGAFNNGAPECDQNDDGACTPSDFAAWISNFNAGCP